jgi:hypothetical protein
MSADRRRNERRDAERREYRSEAGRREEQAGNRRGARRRRLRLLALAALLLIAVVGWRSACVAPRRAAISEARQAGITVAAALGRARLPMLALAGSAPPVAGDPAAEPLLLLDADRASLESLERRLSPALDVAPGVAEVPRCLAPARFLLGREREARLAWEAVLAAPEADADARAEACVGLGVVALRAALRTGDREDRRFALDHALSQWARVPAGGRGDVEARFGEAVALLLLERPEEARRALDELMARPEAREHADVLRPWLDEQAPEPPSPEAASTGPDAPEPGAPEPAAPEPGAPQATPSGAAERARTERSR